MDQLTELLKELDSPQRKGLEFYDIAARLRNLSDDVVSSDSCQMELLAWAFNESMKDREWDTYYGPMFVGSERETGKTVYSPDKALITASHILYWSKRAQETKNPFMRMRYAGLIYDFCKEVMGDEPAYQTIKIPYVQACIDVVLGGYYQHEIIAFQYVDRGFEIARKLRKDELITGAKGALLQLSSKCKFDDKSPGLWGYQMDILIRNWECFTSDERKVILKEHQQRFDRIELSALNEGTVSDAYIHVLIEQATIIGEYARKIREPNLAKEYLDRAMAVLRLCFISKDGMWAQGMLRMMQQNYRKFQLDKSANRLYNEIQQFGSSALSSLQPFRIPYEIDRVTFDYVIADAMRGSKEEILKKYIYNYIPKQEREKQLQKEQAKNTPLLDLISTVTYDHNGMPINNVGTGTDAEWQKLMYGMRQRMILNAIFLRPIVDKMKEMDILTYDVIIDKYKDSFLIPDTQRPIFEQGIKAYFEGNYIVACHLLIPQFESAIRRLIAELGESFISGQKNPNEGNRYISLDTLLGNEALVRCIGEDMDVYFINLFTDANGFNLRNLICHGLMGAAEFNSTTADRVIHAFMALSEVKLPVD